ncbi:Glycogen synthase, ADP-glucose transglucosylase [Thioalkalivibrio nitratireducens DSM 14787]|uniref:Glycogen synthase n=1 Tax=Thioalkalivibrio nitratireducens (strain DSM 14787 / UNIQEM 213 / ALEN2) TaxID=1255043 RepID=L0DZN0_THIND|nr:glycogen synthase GlgA [Thioalkalivibrio nitratireducens]AGA34447.1 Glycogen synthase, ADP-glucose transglucosylase [Thioalkalivibrio nitratireducens DSM 14787]
MRILFASSEAFPLAKTGGLGDVSSSLPAALKRQRQDVRLVLPAYPRAVSRLADPTRLPGPASAPWSLIQGYLPGTSVMVYLVDWPMYFQRDGDPYRATDGSDWPDNAHRFAAFAQAVAAISVDEAQLDWAPEILHVNDWQTGLVPVLLRHHPRRPPTLFTIHNLAYQGLFPGELRHQLGLPEDLWHWEALEFHGQLSFMKGGLVFSDAITTVSPTYAREIQTPLAGMGLDGVLRARSARLHGILNGVDYSEWNPERDGYLTAHYHADNLEGKAANKASLQEELQLPVRPDLPLLGHVGRMVVQKGIDLLLEACEPFLAERRMQLALVGSGDHIFEESARALARAHPDYCSVVITYNEGLAHQLEAGSDAFLMPSRFEPCGLNQMYSLRYGTPPIVHATGGLADTVIDANPATLDDGTATGFCFMPATAAALGEAIERVLTLFGEPGQERWQTMIRKGMARDFGWSQSSAAYLELYRDLRGSPRG